MSVTGRGIGSKLFLQAVKKSNLVDLQVLRRLYRENKKNCHSALDFAKILVRRQLLTPFQATQLLDKRTQGFFLGPYRIKEVIGIGGMGATIYLAEHQSMQRQVALKVLPAKEENQKLLARFYREARALAAVDHPNVVRAFDISQDEKIHYLAMEYIKGESLHRYVQNNGVLSVKKVIDVLKQVATGLKHIHEKGIVHRDIKPSNLLLNEQGQIKILDLGLVRFSDQQSDQLTRDMESNKAMGTPEYMAPEQLEQFHSVDIRADLYSLGATVYYLLLGKPMFSGKLREILISQQMHYPPALSAVRMGIPLDFEEIINKLLRKNPDERYQTPSELIKDLENLTYSSDRIVPSAKDTPTVPNLQIIHDTIDIFGESNHSKTGIYDKFRCFFQQVLTSRWFWFIFAGLNLLLCVGILMYWLSFK